MAKQPGPDMDSRKRRVLENVDEHGCHIAFIREFDGLPPFAYSVGLYHNFHHPEIFIAGLPIDTMTQAISGLAEKVRAGKMYDAGFDYPELVAGAACRFHLVQTHWQLLFMDVALWFYEAPDFPVLQCLWSDAQENYPWSAVFRGGAPWAQPWLFRDDARDARVDDFVRTRYGDDGADEILKVFDEKSAAPTMTSACSRHHYDPRDWPFERPARIRAFAQEERRYGKVLAAFHEADGSWLFMSEPGADHKRVEVCLGCLAAQDLSLGDIADLPRGWSARRRDDTAAWVRKPQPLVAG
ncbi:MAG TPA: DUF4262 domain-containing protein [Verrucomicrobiae bacterium]|nr:DUF4262 domain-containing protein [Verrucomicrobiae bacterium]